MGSHDPSSTPLREAALAAVAARLADLLRDAAIERARRAFVDTDAEALPRLIVSGTDWIADITQEPGATHYSIGVTVAGYVAGADDLAAEQALSVLHASVVAALAGWTPDEAGLGDVVEHTASFRLYSADESARPAGEFVARFSLLAVAPTGQLFTP